MAWPPSSPRLFSLKLRTRTRTKQWRPEASAARKLRQGETWRGVQLAAFTREGAASDTQRRMTDSTNCAERSDDG